MKSFTGKFASARGWTLLLILFLGAGLFLSACGDEEVPAPTTPAPPPPAPPPAPEPEPEPEPEAPVVPTGLRVSATGMDFIEWSWTPVEDVSGYDVQFSANEAFTDEDEIIARTAEEISYRRDGLEAGTSAYLRVRSATGADDDRVTSDWSTHVTGMTMEAPPPPMAPATPTGLEVSETTQNSITWTWNASEGAIGYVVQASEDEVFELTDTVVFDGVPFTTETSYTATDLEPGTTLYVRVAAGVGTPTDPVLSAWTTHVTGTTMAARLAAPANVRVKSRGSNYIEWEWDEVDGADGYQAHFSTDSGFSDPNNFEISGGSRTTQRVANLDAESDGYFRVRAYSGTVTDRTFGDWSEADMATTEEPPPPPPAEPLDAPTGVTTSNEQDNSITVSWDEVDDAEEYEVEQRSNGGAWVDASCGSETADSIVTDTSCVASGLDEDTPYDFRVRAFPDSDDGTLTQSAWSDTASGETTGEAPPPPIMIEDDELGLQWSSAEDPDTPGTHMITWDWDPVADRAQRGIIDNYVALLVSSGDECPALSRTTETGEIDAQTATDTVWRNLGSDISATLTITGNGAAGATRALCVVRSWDDDRDVRQFGDVSVAWASTVPSFDSTTVPAVRNHDTTRLTTSITWDYQVDEGFRYELRVLTADRDDMLPTAGCEGGRSAGSPSASTTDDVNLTHRETSLDPYTHYRLCVRATNGDGASAWQGVGDAMTRPAAPSPLHLDSDDTTTDSWGGQRATRLVWTVAEKTGTPRDAAMYQAKGFRTTDNIASGNLQARCTSASNDLTLAASNAGMGIALTTTDADLNTAGQTPAQYHFYACVRADPDGTPDNDDEGAWAVAKRSYVDGRPTGTIAGLSSGTPTASSITWTWDRFADANSGYEVLFAEGSTVTEDTAGVIRRTVGQPGTTASPTVTFSGLKANTGYAIRIRYRQTVSGRILVSTDNTGTATTAAQ